MLFVLLAGAVLGPEKGAISVLLWILLGVFGLPVFSGGKAGPMVLLGPTGGYLIGFIAAAYIVGRLSGSVQASRLNIGAAMLTGLIVAYCIGLAGFMASFAFFLQKPMTVEQGLSIAVLPFVPFDLIKVAIGASIAPTLRRALSQIGFNPNRA